MQKGWEGEGYLAAVISKFRCQTLCGHLKCWALEMSQPDSCVLLPYPLRSELALPNVEVLL